MSPRIAEMFAFVVSDAEPDDEGVIGMTTLRGWMPLVGADMARADSLMVVAQSIADQLGKEVRLIRFGGPPEIVERLLPTRPVSGGNGDHRGRT